MTSEVAVVEGDTPCVVKRCRDPRYLEWLSREHQVLLALADSWLPVPCVLGYAQVDKNDERCEAWLVMSRLEGCPLWHEILDANSQRRARLLQRAGALLRRLHATPVPLGLRSESPWVDRMLAAARDNLEWCEGTVELLTDLRDRRPEPFPNASSTVIWRSTMSSSGPRTP
jgi:aminoglycoside phosphotransferase (APT) family kinase protein